MNSKSREFREQLSKDIEQRAIRDFADNRYDWLRSSMRRKILVIFTMAVLLVYGLAMHFDWVFVTLPAIMLYGVCLWLLRVTVRRAMDYPDSVVDERIRQIRGVIYRHAFVAIVVLLSCYMSFYIVNQLGAKYGVFMPLTSDQLHDWSFVLLFSAIAMPSAIHAWVAKDV